MAEWGTQITWAFESAQDLSNKRYHFVSINGTQDQQIVLHTTSGGLPLGVLQTKPKSLEFGTVCLNGITKLVAGGTISAGDLITSSASGTAIKVTSGSLIVGRAISGVASGGIFTAYISGVGGLLS